MPSSAPDFSYLIQHPTPRRYLIFLFVLPPFGSILRMSVISAVFSVRKHHAHKHNVLLLPFCTSSPFRIISITFHVHSLLPPRPFIFGQVAFMARPRESHPPAPKKTHQKREQHSRPVFSISLSLEGAVHRERLTARIASMGGRTST